MDLADLMKEVNRLEKELVRTEKKLEDKCCENEKLRQELMDLKKAQENTKEDLKEDFLVVVNANDKHPHSTQLEFRFKNYNQMINFIYLVLSHGTKGLKVTIKKGAN
jgi:septal ring factor EnvC (AmiA/AmiB activator)